MSNQWHYSQEGAQYGPVDEAEIIQLIQDGELPIGTPVLQEGHMDWQPARNHACFQVEIYPKKKRPPVQAAASTSPKTLPARATQSRAAATTKPAVTPASPLVTTVIVKEKSVLPWVLVIAGVLCFVYPGFLKDDAGGGGDENGDGGGGGGSGRTFAAVVQPILQKSTCYDCHDGSDGAKVKGKFNLMDPESVKKMVTAGDDVNSEFIGRLTDVSDPMPPEGKGDMLSTDDVAKIKAWINAGAKF